MRLAIFALLAGCGRVEFLPIDDDNPRGFSVSTADFHSCATADGTLACWGINSSGQLGTGDTTPRLVPTELAGRWREVTVGDRHTCAIDTSGMVACWGANEYGQLGVGDTLPRDVPVDVALPTRARSIDARELHTCVLLDDQTVWCWGRNDEGQLGQGDPFDGPTMLPPVMVLDAAPATAVAAGSGHTLVIREGALAGTGRNTQFQLGLGTQANGQYRRLEPGDAGPWRTVAAGQSISCGIRAPDRTLWCWGENGALEMNGTFGYLGLGDAVPRTVPALVDDTHAWRTVVADRFGGCGTTDDGDLLCWGRNVEGQLGTGDTIDAARPTLVDGDWDAASLGRIQACAQDRNGSVWCTGDNQAGQLGTGDLARRNVLTRVWR